jgi:hypothetical protein
MHDAYMRCQEGRFPRPALTNGRPATGLLANSRQAVIDGIAGEKSQHTQQAQNGIRARPSGAARIGTNPEARNSQQC